MTERNLRRVNGGHRLTVGEIRRHVIVWQTTATVLADDAITPERRLEWLAAAHAYGRVVALIDGQA